MAKITPYLQRRGDTFFFRIQVPLALQTLVGTREISRTLRTGSRVSAQPIALELGAIAKRLFHELRHPTMSRDQMLKLLQAAREKLKIADLTEQHQQTIDDLQARHTRDLRVATLQAQVSAYERALAGRQQAAGSVPISASEGPPGAPKPTPTAEPTVGFHAVVDEFLADYDATKYREMFAKHQAVLGMMKDIIGDKPITELRQTDIIDFFDVVRRLPPKWKAQSLREGKSARELAKLDHPVTLSPKTFEGTYLASVKGMLRDAKLNWQDRGFPTTLTAEGVKYKGDRVKGENHQRAFTSTELKRLLQGPELMAWKDDPAQVHKFWLPHIGLFTGARVNEICQLNPQTDVVQDRESGIWHFVISEETQADERITKSVKNNGSRRLVPIHSTLIALGLLDYIAEVKRTGARLIFPAWLPYNGRASGEAEKWFREFLAEIGLRDETPKKRLVGMHAFRATISARAKNSTPRLDATPITGHADGVSAVVRGYEGELDLINKQNLLEAIDFKIDLLPAKPLGSVDPVAAVPRG